MPHVLAYTWEIGKHISVIKLLGSNKGATVPGVNPFIFY